MTTYSQSDLATRVLRDLGLIGAEEVPSATDLQWSAETVGSEVALLGAIGLPIWNGSDLSVPLEYLVPLSRRIGLAVAPSFGLIDTASALLAMREAERTLTVMANPRGGNPLPLVANDAVPRRLSGFDIGVRPMTALPFAFGTNQSKYAFAGEAQLINAYAEQQGPDAKDALAVLPAYGMTFERAVTDTPQRVTLIFYGKVLIWDKCLGWGSTDAVAGSVADWAGAIMAFYFGKRGIENVARIVGNRFGGR